jgi:hypothetical protein
MGIKSIALVVSTLVLSTSVSAATIDQMQTTVNAGFGFGSGGNEGQQSVTTGITGTLAGFEFVSNGIGLATSVEVDVFVNVGSPLQVDANDFEATVTLMQSDVGDWFFVDVSSANIFLNSGQEFTIGLTPNGPFDLGVGVSDPYSAGDMYFNSSIQSSDFAFRTHMSAVPVQAAVWLFGSGLIGLVGLARRKPA